MVISALDYGTALALEMVYSRGMFEYKKVKLIKQS